MRRSLTAFLFAATAAFLSACQSAEAPKPGNSPANEPKPAASASPSTPAASPTTDPKGTPAAKAADLEGQWTGQGGSSLTVSKKGENYSIEIKKDGKTEKFDGMEKNGALVIKRGDKAETLQIATPAETGLTWTGGEKTCIVVIKGSEAYCKK